MIIAKVFAHGQTWNRVKTLLDHNASDFQRRAPVSGSRLLGEIGDFGDRKTAQPNTENHRNTPKITESSRGCRGQRDWLCRVVTPDADLAFHRQACHLAVTCLPPPGATRHRGFCPSGWCQRGNAEQLLQSKSRGWHITNPGRRASRITRCRRRAAALPDR